MNTDNDGDSSDEVKGAQTALSETNSGNVHAAAQQLEAGVSRFAQDDQRDHESLVALVRQVSQQVRTTDADVRKDRAQIDKLSNWILNNRR